MRILLVSMSIIATMAFAATLVWAFWRPGVSPDAVDAAMAAFRTELGSIPAEGSLWVVDFTQPSFRRRLVAIDLASGGRCFTRVAHGRESGGLFATRFSDTAGSHMSSLGLYRIGEEYVGTHGRSLRLTGLEDLNRTAAARGIVIHSASYVSSRAMLVNGVRGFRIGRSDGCFAVEGPALDALIANLRRPAFLFAFATHR